MENQTGNIDKFAKAVAAFLAPYMKELLSDVDTYQIEETIKDEMHDVAREAAEDALSDRFEDMFSSAMYDNDVITNDTIGDWVHSEDNIKDICSDKIRRVLADDVSIRLEVD